MVRIWNLTDGSLVREIEAVGRLPVSGVISNTHLMDETTPAIVLDGYDRAVETAGEESLRPLLEHQPDCHAGLHPQ